MNTYDRKCKSGIDARAHGKLDIFDEHFKLAQKKLVQVMQLND